MTYAIWVWSTTAAQQVTASASSRGTAIWKPRFVLCPLAHKASCTIGSLPANEAIELLVKDRIGTTTLTGSQMTLTVIVTARDLSPAEATIATLVGLPTPPPTTIPPLPPVTYYPGVPGTTVTPGSLSTLFPVVTPSPTGASGLRGRRAAGDVSATASSLPIDPRLIGGQLAGLAVLAAAITMAIARLSLRTPSPASATSAGSKPAKPPAPDADQAGPAT